MKKVVTAAVFSTFAAGLLAAADFKKTSLITIPQTIELKAAPADVWKVVTTWEGFGALTGFKPTDGQKGFSKVGESVTAQVWNDTGTLVVTRLVPQKELRVAWEPDNASYLCAKRILVKPSAAGTTLEYWDRYSDEDRNPDATANKVVKETAEHVAAFRKMVEK